MRKEKEFYRKLLRLALPIAFQALMLAMVAAADAFMLGAVRQDYMSAVSLATQIQFIQNMCMMAIIGSVTILGAQYWGKQDLKAMDDIFAIALRLCGLVSIVFLLAVYFFQLS